MALADGLRVCPGYAVGLALGWDGWKGGVGVGRVALVGEVEGRPWERVGRVGWGWGRKGHPGNAVSAVNEVGLGEGQERLRKGWKGGGG